MTFLAKCLGKPVLWRHCSHDTSPPAVKHIRWRTCHVGHRHQQLVSSRYARNNRMGKCPIDRSSSDKFACKHPCSGRAIKAAAGATIAQNRRFAACRLGKCPIHCVLDLVFTRFESVGEQDPHKDCSVSSCCSNWFVVMVLLSAATIRNRLRDRKVVPTRTEATSEG